MYAVIKTGGKQYRVNEGDTLKVEKLAVDAGKEVVFDEVLLLNDGKKIEVGTPIIKKAKVSATVEKHGKDKKITIIKFRRRKHSMTKQGHRQLFSKIKINKISK